MISTPPTRRGRIGRGGRVIWDRVPVKGPLPAREDGLADPEESPLVVHSSYVQFPFKAPSAHVLHPPMVNLNVSRCRGFLCCYNHNFSFLLGVFACVAIAVSFHVSLGCVCVRCYNHRLSCFSWVCALGGGSFYCIPAGSLLAATA